ncbi:MAG: IS1634 family transposase [Phormidesmis sp.]
MFTKRGSDLKALEKRLEKATRRAQTQLDKLSRQPFACEVDAQQALYRFEKTLKQHCLTQVVIVEKPQYDTPGRPAKTAIPTHLNYHIQATLTLDTEVIERHQRRAGRFILATNVLTSSVSEMGEAYSQTGDDLKLSADDILTEYKAQQGVERGFRFLKDPLFFAASVFLKSPERIMALAMVMALCLLVYNLGQRQLRQALNTAKETIPNQLGKPTQTPTLRWVFQSFMAVHLVVLNGQQQVLNLNENHRKILRFLGSAAQEYDLLC